jgi:hypothetical protein
MNDIVIGDGGWGCGIDLTLLGNASASYLKELIKEQIDKAFKKGKEQAQKDLRIALGLVE